MNKKLSVVILIILSMMCSGCEDVYRTPYYNNNDKITSDTNYYSLEIDDQEVELHNFKASIKKMEGMDILWTYDADKDEEFCITYSLNVTKGKFKLVLISPDNTVTTLIEKSNEADKTGPAVSTMHIKEGLNRIKLIAEKDSKCDINLSIDKGRFNQLGI